MKFDTTSETVIDSIALTVGSNPRGLSTDANFVYIALNKPAGGNSEILKVDKTNLTTQTTIDTTASNTNGGTFTTFVFNDFLVWSDQSNHIGIMTISTQAKLVFTTVDANSNHFMDIVGTDIWVAGEGSAVVSTVSLPSTGGGGGSEHETRPTFGLSHTTYSQFVDYGLQYNEISYAITHNYHTDFPKQEVRVGEMNVFKAKAFVPYGVKVMEFDFGIPVVGEAHNSEVMIQIWLDNELKVTKTDVLQKENLVDKKSLRVSASETNCSVLDIGKNCIQVVAKIIFLEQPFNDIFAIKAIDNNRRVQTTYLNEGLDVTGNSLNPPDTALMAQGKNGLVLMTQIDKFENLWQDPDGLFYTTNSFDSWIRLSPYVIEDNDPTWNVMTRYNDKFILLKEFEANRAIGVFDSSEIQSVLPDFKPHSDFLFVEHLF